MTTPSGEVHVLVTGKAISGRIPVDTAIDPAGFIDVTPDVLTFDSASKVQAVADAIAEEHAIRGTFDKANETGV